MLKQTKFVPVAFTSRLSLHQSNLSWNPGTPRKRHSSKVKDQMVERNAWGWPVCGKLAILFCSSRFSYPPTLLSS